VRDHVGVASSADVPLLARHRIEREAGAMASRSAAGLRLVHRKRMCSRSRRLVTGGALRFHPMVLLVAPGAVDLDLASACGMALAAREAGVSIVREWERSGARSRRARQ